MVAHKRDTWSRRQLLHALVTAGAAAPVAAEALEQSRTHVSVDNLRSAESLIGQHYDDERLRVIDKALQRNLDQFQIVRDLVIDDLVEPAPMFFAKGR